MSTPDWATKAADAIIAEVVVDHLRDPQKTIASIIAAHAEPLVAELEAQRARYLRLLEIAQNDESRAHDAEQKLEPLVALLKECGRGQHSKGYNEESADYPPCPRSDDNDDDDPTLPCTCGADAWNARVEAALNSRNP